MHARREAQVLRASRCLCGAGLQTCDDDADLVLGLVLVLVLGFRLVQAEVVPRLTLTP